MAKKADIRIYRLKVIFDKSNREILHLSESMDNDGDVSFNIEGEDLTVPKEMADILNRLDDDTLGIS